MFIECIGNDRYLIKEVNSLFNDHWNYVKNIPGIELKKDYNGNLNAIVIHRSLLYVFNRYYKEFTFEEYPKRKLSSCISLPYELRDYQSEAVDFIRSRRGVLLAHDMGMGKTAITLAASLYPALVLVPTTAITVWEREAHNFGLESQVLQGRKASARMLSRSTDLFILTYGSAKYWFPWFKALSDGPNLETVIADEAHYLQRIQVEASRAFRSVARELTIMLSATPVPNRLRSLWSVLDAMGKGAWGSQYDFRRHYCGAFPGPYGGLIDSEPTNVEELQSRISEVTIRRTWEDPDLQDLRPKIERKVIDLDIPVDDKIKLTNDAIQAVFSRLKTSGHNAVTLRYLTQQRRLLGEYKIKAMIDRGFFSRGSHARELGARREVIYVWHKESARALASTLMANGNCPVDLLMGTSTGKHRKAVLNEWEDGPLHQPRILVATLATASECVNLITADTAYFLEFDWAPRRIVQAEKRHHRPGNKNDTVYAYYITLRGTIEDRIANALLEKVDHHETALGPDGHRNAIMTLFNDDDDFGYEETGDVLENLAHRLIANA